jgi:hypothetical protein
MAITRLGGANAITGTIPTSVAPGQGKILQVKQTLKTDVFLTNSNSFIDITGLTVAITPTSTTSKMFVTYQVFGNANGHIVLRLVKLISGTETAIGIGDADGSRIRAGHKKYNVTTYNTSYDGYSMVQNILDTHNTNSEITYKVQTSSPYSSGYYTYVNRTYSTADATWDARCSSEITVMEIEA